MLRIFQPRCCGRCLLQSVTSPKTMQSTSSTGWKSEANCLLGSRRESPDRLCCLHCFGKTPGFEGINEILLSVTLLLMFVSVICNLICVWQIPNWKLAIRTNRVSNGRKMTLDLEITSWISFVVFLAALVCAAIANSGAQDAVNRGLSL